MAPTLPVEFSGQRVSKKLSQNNHNTQMMGKTRKVSKGYSQGFVPDYRHAVDTMANSEGFGSSGRVDTEITASEDSCAPNRKPLNLNPEFGVPIQVLSLSKLSSSERIELRSRLKHELEQVRTLKKNIGMVTSPSDDVHSCSSAGQRKTVPEFSRSMSLPMPKRKAPPGRNGGGARSKKSTRVEAAKKALLPPTSGTGNAMLMKQCETLLNRLMGHSFGWVFNSPVDVVALKIPDYYNVIQHPMDLGTVKTKLMSGKYMDPWGFAGDVRLTFSNAMTYNPRGNDVHLMAETLSKFFEVRWKPIEKKLETVPVRQNVLETETVVPMMPPNKKKKTEIHQQEKMTMSDAEKLKLSSELESSLAELPERIIDFLKENSSSNGNATMEDEIEIDIDTLNDDTLFKLRKLLDDFLVEKQKNMVKDDTREIELHNESGFSNSSMQACKGGNDGNEEDVDIGGDEELPISSFPPVEIEIEKDTLCVRNNNNSKCSSGSSSSTSASGSSSSESDTGSSSGSESDDAKKASTIIANNGEVLSLGTQVNNNTEQLPVALEAKAVNEEQKCESSEAERRQEGESGPSERQVSPDKLYRAALLRSRFADTILKAQEKTTGKIEEQDRERLRLEKEEVEKRRKQEKARLEAEAKAAEEARRNAELEAAAEAKRKREAEREAARQALQKMEKVVDINDGSGFLEEFEMLSVAAPAQPLESLIDESASVVVDHHPFNFDGKLNPLEQLGLFRKDDDDEEEEEVDPEEGEID